MDTFRYTFTYHDPVDWEYKRAQVVAQSKDEAIAALREHVGEYRIGRKPYSQTPLNFDGEPSLTLEDCEMIATGAHVESIVSMY